MLRTVNDQSTLWDAVLPAELLVLPAELARVDTLLDDPVFFKPFALYFDARLGRPSIPVETYLRLIFLKLRYRRVMLERCFDGDLVMVASPPHISAARWAFEYVYRTGGLPAGGAAARLLSRRRRRSLPSVHGPGPAGGSSWCHAGLGVSAVVQRHTFGVGRRGRRGRRLVDALHRRRRPPRSRPIVAVRVLERRLTEFRTLVHYRLRSAPFVLRVLLRAQYRPAGAVTLNADRNGPGLLIQHGVATIVTAESHRSRCWINQQITIGHNATGRPTLGDRVRVGAGAVVLGPITLHDGATIGANATVIHDVGPDGSEPLSFIVASRAAC